MSTKHTRSCDVTECPPHDALGEKRKQANNLEQSYVLGRQLFQVFSSAAVTPFLVLLNACRHYVIKMAAGGLQRIVSRARSTVGRDLYDVVIVGGGMVGSALACALGTCNARAEQCVSVVWELISSMIILFCCRTCDV